MTRALRLNGVDVSDWIPLGVGDTGFSMQTVEQADGRVPDIEFTLLSEYMSGTLQQLTSVLPGGPLPKMDVLDHDGSTVYFAGRINYIETDPNGPANKRYTIKATSYQEDLFAPVDFFYFPASSIVYGGETFDCTRDTERVKYLFAVFLPTYDHTTYIPSSAYTTFTGGTGYYKTNVLNILKEIASWGGPNPDTPVTSRSWFVSADWAAGVTTKYIAYFDRSNGWGGESIALTGGAKAADRVSYYNARRIQDPAPLINGIRMAGPNGEPVEVSFPTTSVVNATAQGNDLTKSGGVSGTWDAGAFGDQSITSEGGYVEAKLSLKNVAVGFSTSNASVSWDTIRFGVRTTYTSGTTGTIDVIYQGTVLAASVSTYTANQTVRVDIRRVSLPTGVFWQGFILLDGVQVYALLFTRAQMDDGTHGGTNRFPMYPDVSLATSAATLNDVTIRRHAYSIHQRADSVTAYGEFWAADTFRDDRLDTYEKRQRKAEQIFDRRAYPRTTFTCTTDGILPNGTRYHYRAGKTVLVYNTALGWNPQLLIISRVTTDWAATVDIDKPVQHLECGDRLIEDGEDDDTGWLTRIPDQDSEAPPVPVGFALDADGLESYYSAWAHVIWSVPGPSDDTRWVWVRGVLQGLTSAVHKIELRFPAVPGGTVISGFVPGRTYFFEIAGEDANGHRSPYGAGFYHPFPTRPPVDNWYNGDFAIPDLVDPTLPDGHTRATTGTASVQRSGASRKGMFSVQLTASGAATATLYGPKIAVFDPTGSAQLAAIKSMFGEIYYEATSHVGTLSLNILYYDAAGAPVISATSLYGFIDLSLGGSALQGALFANNRKPPNGAKYAIPNIVLATTTSSNTVLISGADLFTAITNSIGPIGGTLTFTDDGAGNTGMTQFINSSGAPVETLTPQGFLVESTPLGFLKDDMTSMVLVSYVPGPARLRLGAVSGFDIELHSSGNANLRVKDDSSIEYVVGSTVQHKFSGGTVSMAFDDAATNTIATLLTLDHSSSGTPAANFGAGLKLTLKSSTTAAQDAAQIAAIWTTATHASRNSAITLSVVGNAGALTELMRLVGATSGIGRVLIGTSTAAGFMLDVLGPASTNTGGARISAGSSAGSTSYPLHVKHASSSTSSAPTLFIQPVSVNAQALRITAPASYAAAFLDIRDSASTTLAFMDPTGLFALGPSITAPTALLHIGASTTARAGLRIETGPAPTTPNGGDVWLDDTQHALQGQIGDMRQSVDTTLLTHSGASVTVANTTTETTLLGTSVGLKTVTGGSLSVGKTVRQIAWGYISTHSAAGTINFKSKAGSVVLATTGAQTLPNSLSNELWVLVLDITTRSTGASGTVIGQGYVMITGGAGFVAPVVAKMVNTATVTVDTSVNETLDLTVQWGTANAANTITQTNTSFGVLN